MDATATTNRAVERILALVERETKHLVASVSDSPKDFPLHRLESESIEAVRRIGHGLLTTLCNLVQGYQGKEIPGHADVGDGTHVLSNRGPCHRHVTTFFGEVDLYRHYYHCADPSDSRHPRDEELGLLPRQKLSPGIIEALAHTSTVTGSYDQACKMLAKFTGVEIEYKQAQRECLRIGRALEERALRESEEIFEGDGFPEVKAKDAPEAIVVSVDGITVEHCAGGGMEIKVGRIDRMARRAPPVGRRRRKRKKKRKKRRKTRARTRKSDPKRASEIARLKESQEQREYQAADGLVKEALRKAAPKRRDQEQMHPSSERSSYRTSCRGGTEQIGRELWIAAMKMGYQRADARIFLADGSHWCWNLCRYHFTDAEEILDVFHLARNVIKAANALWGDRSKKALVWRRKAMVALLRGKVDQVLTELSKLSFIAAGKRNARDQLLGYLKNNRKRVDYPRYMAAGYPISSAMIEGACRHVIGARMKGSGRRWDEDGAEAMARLRALHCGGEWTKVFTAFKQLQVKRARSRRAA